MDETLSTTETLSQLVYKYLPPRGLTYLDDELLRFTQPGALNDPFECAPVLSDENSKIIISESLEDQREKICRELVDRPGDRKQMLKLWRQTQAKLKLESPAKIRDEYLEEIRQRLNSEAGILCLSRKWESTLMWSHYTDSHQGFCVGFNRAHEFFSGHGLPRFDVHPLRPVSYSRDRVQVPIKRGQKLRFEHIFTKCVDWEYEAEERMSIRRTHAAKVVDNPTYPINLFVVPHKAVGEIIIGARATPDVKSRATDFATRLSVPIYEAFVSDETFDMGRRLFASHV
jgi:hypothetical protein